MISCSVSIEFASATQANHVLQAIQLDDEGFVQSRVEGTRLHAEISSESVPSLLHTLDDYLACVTVAGGIVGTKKGEKKETA